MKKTIYTVFTFLFLISFSALFAQENDLKGKIASSWAKYINNPTPENAQLLANVFPHNKMRSAYSFLDIFESEYFQILEINALSGEDKSIDVMFRILSITDAYMTEAICQELGLVLRVNPHAFLKGLKRNYQFKHLKDAIVGDFGIFTTSDQAAEYERQYRIKALESVTDKDLVEIKKECLKILKEKR
jgi:hypothetical protein